MVDDFSCTGNFVAIVSSPFDVNVAGLKCPIQVLPGEVTIRLGCGAFSETIMLTTYRLFITYSKSFINIPLRMVESVDISEIAGITAVCKDGTVHRLVCCVYVNGC